MQVLMMQFFHPHCHCVFWALANSDCTLHFALKPSQAGSNRALYRRDDTLSDLIAQQCFRRLDESCAFQPNAFKMPQQEKRPEVHIDERWDHVINVTFSRTLAGLACGLAGGMLLFRGGPARVATMAFGSGIGIGSAYQQCNSEFRELLLPK